jgi:DNA-binding response OmpR family regulator
LAILDVMMPQRNGFEVCQDLRSDPQQQNLRIIMLTAKGRETEVAKGLALGADHYMTKPFSTRELVAKVKALLADG